MNATILRTGAGARAWTFHAALHSCALIAVCLVAGASARADTDLGTWLNSDKNGKIALRECGEQSLCGEIVWLKDPRDENGRPWRDQYNRDVSLRKRFVVGINVLTDIKKIGPMTWQGYIYDPEVGKIYYLKHLKVGRDKVEIKGCLQSGWPCRTKYWTRTKPIRPPAPPVVVAKARPAPKPAPRRRAAMAAPKPVPKQQTAMAAPVVPPAPALAPTPPKRPQLRGPIPPAQAAQPAAPDITAALPYPAANPRPGGYLVQLAARQNHNDALRAFDDLQRRYPQLLAGMVPEIMRADLGPRGIWYRVGVGPMAQRSAAADFCQRLKMLGADCLIRQR
ncbi:MAG: DUF2147 domain-containing protein [Methyloligellaceae bacterium]